MTATRQTRPFTIFTASIDAGIEGDVGKVQDATDRVLKLSAGVVVVSDERAAEHAAIFDARLHGKPNLAPEIASRGS